MSKKDIRYSIQIGRAGVTSMKLGKPLKKM